ncbi:bifunctional glycosyltransferase/CDP-glycerol:glycerophosphate glycerophosphotransferase [Candidatus Enterococcus leclercqii]|uniref:bifunctional glycosyltransferase/CDP-glycerol:glycerophosphate glycerophosphotransferase n=1 Tax=Candidatus Enterococcus leclercqii TaxID=1857218 RepID=UPI001F35D37A|nr:CDP-glycerol glycerophosphotransferase family protein [Enterococcus sp. CU9D]
MFDVSVIIPAYNAEKTIDDLFLSILNQSFSGKVECLLIDDNSQDATIKKAESYLNKFDEKNWSLRILSDGLNKRQGARRNEGICQARGAYILFIDSDDFIHSKTLELSVEAAKSDSQIDMVYFNFAMYSDSSDKEKRYTPRVYNRLYSNGDILYGEECEKLFDLDPFFTINKLYKKSFLLQNKILYGEGYFYEDFEFYVHSAQSANKIKLLPNVLYYVRIHENSTTQSYSDSTVHLDSFINAITSTYKNFHPRNDLSSYHVLKYFIHRLLLYIEKRMNANEKVKREYRNKAFKILYDNNQSIVYPKNYYSNLYYMIFGMKLFENKKFNLINKIYKVYLYNPKLLRKVKITRRANNELIGNRIDKFIYRPRIAINLENMKYKFTRPDRKKASEPVIPENNHHGNLRSQILMLGFDYRYVGNSKYLFEFLSTKYSGNELKFVTDDLSVPEDYRLEPRSNEFYAFMDDSKVIIAESWIPLDYEFYSNQYIIQLWHGTPLKKVLYDSPEREIIRSNPSHKTKKMFDINRWNALISDSEIATDKFLSAYSIEKSKIKEYGYPRNRWLIDHKNDENLKDSLKKKLGIPEDKLVICYLPTWRDYNFRNASQNNGYLLEKERLLENMDPSFEFVFLEKAHDLTNDVKNNDENTIYISSEEDIQPYLLITDIVISDYSSVIFDCLYIDVPFFLFYKDYDYYKDVRGTYEDMNQVLNPCIVYSEKELAEKIITYKDILANMDLDKYKCNEIEKSCDNIHNLIQEYFEC